MLTRNALANSIIILLTAKTKLTVHEIGGLDSIQDCIAIRAGALGFSETTVPPFGYTVACSFIAVIA